MEGQFEFRPSSTWSERLHRLRNYQSRDFWAMVFARPLTILLLWPVADARWLTAALITWSSLGCKLVGMAVLLVFPGWWGGVGGGLLINLGLVLDNMDGTLCRYRGTSTFSGYYLDKAVDIIGMAGMFAAIALRAWWKEENVLDVFGPFLGFAGCSVAAYCKWIAHRVETDFDLVEHRNAGTLAEYAARRVEQNPSTPPPSRTWRDWLAFLGRAISSILEFNEVDIYFFLLVALVAGREWIFTQVLCGFYALGLVVGPAVFYVKLRRRERGGGS